MRYNYAIKLAAKVCACGEPYSYTRLTTALPARRAAMYQSAMYQTQLYIYVSHENEKKKEYDPRAKEVEKATLTAAVMSTSGGTWERGWTFW